MDEQWASLTRHLYTSIGDDAELRVKLCTSYAAECRKQYALTGDRPHLEEAQLWELGAGLYSGPVPNPTSTSPQTMEELLVQPGVGRIMALKEWLEEGAEHFEPARVKLQPLDLDEARSRSDPATAQVAHSAFNLLRQGKLEQASDYLVQSGAAWKAAVLQGGKYDRSREARLVWRAAVERLLATDSGWEAAWLGVLVGNGRPAARALRSAGLYTWKEALWLSCVSVIDKTCEQFDAHVAPSQVFANIDAAKDGLYYACKTLFLECSQPGVAVLGDERLALHLALVVGDRSNADALLTEWIWKRQGHVYSVWYLSLLSSVDSMSQLLGRMLCNAADSGARKTILFAAQDAELSDVIPRAIHTALDALGAANAVDLLDMLPDTASAIRHVVDSSRRIIDSNSQDWLAMTADLGKFYAKVPETVMSSDSLDALASQPGCEPLVAELVTYLHICRIGSLYRDYKSASERSQGPKDSHHQPVLFGAANKYAERSGQAWRLRLDMLASSFAASCEELLQSGGAWNAACLQDNPNVSKVRAVLTPVLVGALQDIK